MMRVTKLSVHIKVSFSSGCLMVFFVFTCCISNYLKGIWVNNRNLLWWWTWFFTLRLFLFITFFSFFFVSILLFFFLALFFLFIISLFLFIILHYHIFFCLDLGKWFIPWCKFTCFSGFVSESSGSSWHSINVCFSPLSERSWSWIPLFWWDIFWSESFSEQTLLPSLVFLSNNQLVNTLIGSFWLVISFSLSVESGSSIS